MTQEKTTDKWVKCIAKGGNMIATAITAKGLVEEGRRRHKTRGAETRGLGEALLGALLLGSTCKTGERVSLSLKGNKFFRQAIADATPEGTVRGFVIAKEYEGDLNFELGPWQEGLLSIARLKANEKEPYVGTVPLITGHLAKDLTYYLSQSEQIASSVGIAVNVADDGHIKEAGAFLVQALPGADKREVDLVDRNIQHLQSLAARLSSDTDPTKLLATIFDDTSFVIIGEQALKFECNCSRDRVIRALAMVGKAELDDMAAKDKGATVTCDFCGEVYTITEKELGDLNKR